LDIASGARSLLAGNRRRTRAKEPRQRLDRASRLPVRILLEASAHVEGKSRDSFEFYDFAWNELLAENTFSLDPPEDYTLKKDNLPTE